MPRTATRTAPRLRVTARECGLCAEIESHTNRMTCRRVFLESDGITAPRHVEMPVCAECIERQERFRGEGAGLVGRPCAECDACCCTADDQYPLYGAAISVYLCARHTPED